MLVTKSKCSGSTGAMLVMVGFSFPSLIVGFSVLGGWEDTESLFSFMNLFNERHSSVIQPLCLFSA